MDLCSPESRAKVRKKDSAIGVIGCSSPNAWLQLLTKAAHPLRTYKELEPRLNLYFVPQFKLELVRNISPAVFIIEDMISAAGKTFKSVFFPSLLRCQHKHISLFSHPAVSECVSFI
ncbi:hypothetical protein ATANTOWER_000740 [Ataeniobius toweri]|uniref:Uncharacterized protein n=1 Tax=Ataeniobius toweri TaxID=208326 RepID=A0ABU7C5H6_9TELE|nr:hypothetical protein [Ataeniobius toweri]